MSKLFYLPDAIPQTKQFQQEAIENLESGQVLFLPQSNFKVFNSEKNLLHPNIIKKSYKNISYQARTKCLKGSHLEAQALNDLQNFMARFSKYAYQALVSVLPAYERDLHWGRTSYRPCEIAGRVSSYRKDDTRLHVDSFAATPVHGLRILRVFCNINPENLPRVWHLGEPFEEVCAKFLPRVKKYHKTRAKLLKTFKVTKSLRTAYDHYMLQLHNNMKADLHYQNTVTKSRFDFPANSTWIVFTDSVSHAALSGQHLLEQTFYLPITAMHSPEKSPWSILQGHVAFV